MEIFALKKLNAVNEPNIMIVIETMWVKEKYNGPCN